MSVGFLVPASSAMVWRGPMVMSAIKQLLLTTAWPALHTLVLDLPPGTGDVPLSIVQQVQVTGGADYGLGRSQVGQITGLVGTRWGSSEVRQVTGGADFRFGRLQVGQITRLASHRWDTLRVWQVAGGAGHK